MNSFLRWTVVPFLAAALFAQTATPPKAKKAPAKPAEPAVTAADVQALKDALAAQQQQIQQLQQALTQRDQAVQTAQQQAQQAQATATDAEQKAAAAQSASADKEAVAKLNSDLTDVKSTVETQLVASQDDQRRVSALENAFGRFRLSGDVRVRGENFNQENMADRNRARVRVRFGFDGKLNEDFVGGVALATGSLGDPSSTNETLTNNFDRKTEGSSPSRGREHPSRSIRISTRRVSMKSCPSTFIVFPAFKTLRFKACSCSTTRSQARAASITAMILLRSVARLRQG
jgi:multidrug efflux pump subunit AcrA (membrane-fusion protein)